jgi:glycosyltransferase involved in cell wall biosynthesis
MITVLSVIDTGGPGGAETVYLQTCTGLDPARFRMVCIVSRDGWLAGALRERGVEPLIIPSSGSLNVKYLRQLMKVARQVRTDVIIGHLYGSAVYCSLAGRLLGLPVLSVLHGQSDISKGGRFGGVKKMLVRVGTRRLIFVSDRLKEELMPVLGVAARKCAVIPNGVDVSRFEAPSTRPLRAEMGFGMDDILVGAVGNIRAPKSYDVLLRAAALLRQRSHRYRFVIVGENNGELFDRLLDLRRQLGLEQLVIFAGLRADIPDVMKSFDVYALSSSTEGFSIACVEAMSAGTPVVATRSGGPQEILQHEHSGLLVPVQDPLALADAIERIANDGALAATLAANARLRVKERYTLAGMLDAYGQLFTEAAPR